MPADPKSTLKSYIDARREALISKVEDLSERDARLPRTPTGTNLLGIIKHVIGVEAVYLGATFGRPFPEPGALISDEVFEVDPQADWYATEDETLEGIIGLYRRVIAHGDETIDALPLDAIGHVPHWGGDEVTLHQMLVHLFADLAGHGGQADILREEIDGAVGWRKAGDNIPSEYDWSAYVAKLTEIANRF
ncbi:DinB family protein [Nocardioides panzhihuensis]|uniref:Putative damage-inducible protein DinB n=1 Tax=Nocardioides panzhihuensis TaxID=860243 RepID=A0A7Z0DQZ7_9ACTN|nr:DinB family protein [Nocardioides panzhihuensis]NYI80174.1 putative damage-inducible protein DinB [Nocardioides panzhihuensis]